MELVKGKNSKNIFFKEGVNGALSLTISTIIIKVLGLVYKIPLANMLGDEGMGYFNSAYTVYAFFYILCTAGVPKAIMVILSEEDNKGRRENEKKIINYTLYIYLTLGLILTLVFVLFSNKLAQIIGNSKSTLTMISIAPSIIFISLLGVLRGVFSSKFKFLDIAVSQIIEGISKLVFGLIFAVLGTRLALPLEISSALTILGISIGSVLGFLYLFVLHKIAEKGINLRQNKLFDKSEIRRKLFKISLPITLSALVMSLTNMIDLGMIMRSLIKMGYSEVEASALFGNYTTLSVPMFNLAISLITPITVAFLPILTKHRNNKSKDVYQIEKELIEFTSFVAAPITFGLIIFPEEILSLLFKNSKIQIGAELLILLAPSIIFASSLLIINTILESAGYFSAPLISMTFGGIAKFIVSGILIKNPSFAIAGAPIGTLVSYAVALITSLIIHERKLSENIPLISKSAKSYISAFFSVVIAKCLYLSIVDSIGSTISLLLSIAFASIIYLIVSFLSGIVSLHQKEISTIHK